MWRQIEFCGVLSSLSNAGKSHDTHAGLVIPPKDLISKAACIVQHLPSRVQLQPLYLHVDLMEKSSKNWLPA